jgi:hypothetical protein
MQAAPRLRRFRVAVADARHALRRRLVAASVATLVQAAGQAAPEQAPARRLDVALAAGVTCSRQVGPATNAGAGALSLSCPDAAGTVSCSGPDIEPLDVAAAAVCRIGRLPLQPAPPVPIAFAIPAMVTVEWLTIGGDATLTRVAARTMRASGLAALPIAAHPDRFMRFSRQDASPITVSSTEITSRSPWSMPEARPGGEILGVVEEAVVRPAAYRVSGPVSLDVQRAGSRAVSMPGLPDGAYTVTPLYAGGLTGLPVRASVTSARSVIVRLRREDVGAADVSAAPEACAAASGLVLKSVVGSPQGTGIRSALLRIDDLTGCRWSLDGLPPGRYEAALRGGEGSAGSTDFVIHSQKRVDVAIAPAVARVSGVVRYRGEPVRNGRLDFSPRAGGGSVRATLDSTGAYVVQLNREGEHIVTLRSDRLLETRVATAVAGENVLDWNIAGRTSLTVHVDSRDGATATSLELRGRDGSQFWSHTSLASTDSSAGWDAIPFGLYEVSASQGTRASPVVTVALDETQPEVIVRLTLRESSATMVVRDEAGRPVSRVGFSMIRPTPEEISPGVYALASVPRGMRLRLRPPAPYAPACRIATGDAVSEAVLRPGRQVRWTLPESHLGGLEEFGGLLGVEGSDCDIPLGDFLSSKTVGRGERRNSFVILNFPADDELLLATSRGAFRLVITSDGAVQLLSAGGGGR